MNPNRLSRELRDLPGNVHSNRFPGGSIVSAVLDRRLMTWSDRGGASRIFGEIWSEYCWQLLTDGDPGILASSTDLSNGRVLRLDADPRIAIQAGRHKLPNPDFLAISHVDERSMRIRAIDAKFAIDRLRRSQISPESIQELIEIPGSLVNRQIRQGIRESKGMSLDYEAGVFVGPHSLLNDFYYRKLTSGDNPKVPASEIRLVEATQSDLFSRTPEIELMSLLRSIDGLEETEPSTEVVAGMYYLRLACASRWFEQQSRAPLLSLRQPEPIPIEDVVRKAEIRMVSGSNAFEVIEEWSRNAEKSAERQAKVKDAARFPIRMAELRDLVRISGDEDDRKRLRLLRGSLEKRYMRQLIEEVGEIPADPAESLSSAIRRVREASRRLKPDLMKQASLMIERFDSQPTTAGDSGSSE